jgi:TetR/AcrR family transcriptional regulator, transcriptional repressor for nem operon
LEEGSRLGLKCLLLGYFRVGESDLNPRFDVQTVWMSALACSQQLTFRMTVARSTLACIQSRGLNAMSFQDLSNSVGIRKASVHHHFANKSDMVSALLARYREQFAARVERILQTKSSGAAKLKSYFALFSETLQEEPHEKSCLCGILAAELLSLSEQTVEQVRDFFRDNTSVIVQILRYGRQDGTLSYRGDPTRFAAVILSSLEGALLISRCEGGSERLDSVLRMLLDLARAD